MLGELQLPCMLGGLLCLAAEPSRRAGWTSNDYGGAKRCLNCRDVGANLGDKLELNVDRWLQEPILLCSRDSCLLLHEPLFRPSVSAATAELAEITPDRSLCQAEGSPLLRLWTFSPCWVVALRLWVRSASRWAPSLRNMFDIINFFVQLALAMSALEPPSTAVPGAHRKQP